MKNAPSLNFAGIVPHESLLRADVRPVRPGVLERDQQVREGCSILLRANPPFERGIARTGFQGRSNI